MPTNRNSKWTVPGIVVLSTVALAAIAVVQPAVMLNVSESVSVADTPRALPAVILNVRESISVADAPAPVSAALVNDHEPVSVTDSVTVKIVSTDLIPPTTTATLTSGRACGVTDVLLSATDEPGGSGVKNIQFSIDGGPAVAVTGASTSITFTTDGAHSLTFFATDNAGNVEASHTLSIPIDQTAPHITCPAPITAECTGGSSAA